MRETWAASRHFARRFFALPNHLDVFFCLRVSFAIPSLESKGKTESEGLVAPADGVCIVSLTAQSTPNAGWHGQLKTQLSAALLTRVRRLLRFEVSD